MLQKQHIEWRASGRKLRSSGWMRGTDTPYTAQDVAELAHNAHLAHHINTLMPQIFPGPPQVHVVDDDGNEPDPALSTAISNSLKDCGLYASMRRAYADCLLYGCAIRSVALTATDSKKYLLVSEIRDLPASSFCTAPAAAGATRTITPNSLMPGLIVRDGRLEAHQTDPYTLNVHKLENWDIICDPTAPQPFGEAYCLPIYPILESLAIAEFALDLSVQRRGVPLLTLKVRDDLPPSMISRESDIVTTAEEFVEDWGMRSGAILPAGIEVPPISSGIIDGADAHERVMDLDALLDSFFSPAAALSPGRADTQSLFGASQQSRAQIWRAHIAGQQAWIEEAYEKLLEGLGLLTANGCPDSWRLEIRFDRPAEDDIHVRRLNELSIAIQAGVVSPKEIRERLDCLDLAAVMPDTLIAPSSGGGGQAAPSQSMPMPVGNVAAQAPDELATIVEIEGGHDGEIDDDANELADLRREAADIQDDALIDALHQNYQDYFRGPALEKWIKAKRSQQK